MEMLTKIDHIGIAVRDIERSVKLYGEVFGIEPHGGELVESMGVKVVFLAVGESKVELLEALDEKSPVASFLEKRGEGIHHVCYEVTDIEKCLTVMKEKDYRLIDEKPRTGAEGRKIAFLHPASASGVLVELKE